MADNKKWETMGHDIQFGMTDNGNDRYWEIAYNGKWQTIENDRQWWMVDNKEIQAMGNDRYWVIIDNDEWQAMVNGRQLEW